MARIHPSKGCSLTSRCSGARPMNPRAALGSPSIRHPFKPGKTASSTWELILTAGIEIAFAFLTIQDS